MEMLTNNELVQIDGGKLSKPSDVLLLAGSICFCFCAPEVGIPMAVMVALY